jgi:hypothetical protein
MMTRKKRRSFAPDQRTRRAKAYAALMRIVIRCAAAAVGVALATTIAFAQQPRTVGGMIVNFGIVPAEVALRAEGHRDQHPTNPPPGSQHLLITLDDEKTGKRISDPDVFIEVTDPNGHVEKKPLLHTQGGGLPDYSELFRFPSPGEYSLRVIITPKSGGKPIETQFKVKHAI